jgi:regulator of protease activity HflC (stomatin/prohibitin superfamily)
MEFYYTLVLASLLVAGLVAVRKIERTIIYEYEKGLLYKHGKMVRVLDAGTYRIWRDTGSILKIDMRKQQFTVSGQEILTKDHINIRVSIVGSFRILVPELPSRMVQNVHFELQTITQLALRSAISQINVEELLNGRDSLESQVLSKLSAEVKPYGVEFVSLAARDIMLPTNLKRAYAGVLEAQKDTQRNLEKARGEQAVLRSLANSSKMYQENPSLLQARIIQALAAGNNSVVFGAEAKFAVEPAQAKRK